MGKIDCVLVRLEENFLDWCALEMQAVYFSGDRMGSEFESLREWTGGGVPLPAARRRPDFQSSGPKRLMPQLQIKVPTLSRWGKKMAVVVDEAFYAALGPMRTQEDLSNADIVWIVVRYDIGDTAARLEISDIRLTTLEQTVEGLTAGVPVSREEFEAGIRKKLR